MSALDDPNQNSPHAALPGTEMRSAARQTRLAVAAAESSKGRRAGYFDRPGSANTLAPVYLKPVVEEAARAGFDVQALFHGLAFVPGDLDMPGFMVSHSEAIELIRRAVRLLNHPRLGLELGMRSKLTDRGALALGFFAAKTLDDAIGLSLQFPRSAGYLLGLSAQRSDDGHAVTAEPLHHEHDLAPMLVDLTFSTMVAGRRQAASEKYSPSVVELVRERPVHASAYEDYFRSPVRFGCLRNRLVSDLAWMDFALPMANIRSYRLALQLLQREAQHTVAISAVGNAVERAIRRALPRLATSDEVAGSLNLSVRTLRRKLAQEGVNYSHLVDAARKARALELVGNGPQSYADLAALTGFADARSFRRAFVRWTGATPSALQIADAGSMPEQADGTA